MSPPAPPSPARICLLLLLGELFLELQGGGRSPPPSLPRTLGKGVGRERGGNFLFRRGCRESRGEATPWVTGEKRREEENRVRGPPWHTDWTCFLPLFLFVHSFLLWWNISEYVFFFLFLFDWRRFLFPLFLPSRAVSVLCSSCNGSVFHPSPCPLLSYSLDLCAIEIKGEKRGACKQRVRKLRGEGTEEFFSVNPPKKKLGKKD